MSELKDIQFIQVKKKWKRSGGRKWKVTKSTVFLEKVSSIRKRADCINAKLKTA